MGNSIQERHELTWRRETTVEPTALNTATAKASCETPRNKRQPARGEGLSGLRHSE